MLMIICASRRTDIPAFHSEWMMNRLRAGYALVRNPVHRTVINRVSLDRRDVDCIVFMTKDPRPMIPNLGEIARMGHVSIFQVTITPYGRDIEPDVPFKADISDACAEIASRIGRERMVWRYDPVIFNGRISQAYHERKFDMMCREASQWTDRCVISFVDVYGKLSRFQESGLIRPVSVSEMRSFARMASKKAEDRGMSLSCCCPRADLSGTGAEIRGCVDASMMRSLDIPYEAHGSPLREGCRCVKSIDIGEYDTCMHGCVYCYANRQGRPSKLFCQDSEMLWSVPTPRDTVVDLGSRDARRLEDFH